MRQKHDSHRWRHQWRRQPGGGGMCGRRPWLGLPAVESPLGDVALLWVGAAERPGRPANDELRGQLWGSSSGRAGTLHSIRSNAGRCCWPMRCCTGALCDRRPAGRQRRRSGRNVHFLLWSKNKLKFTGQEGDGRKRCSSWELAANQLWEPLQRHHLLPLGPQPRRLRAWRTPTGFPEWPWPQWGVRPWHAPGPAQT